VSGIRRTAARFVPEAWRPPAIIESRPGVAEPLLALTFDDGPSLWTDPILNLLTEGGAKATFFVLGVSISGNEDVLRRIVDGGHELGNHTQSHLDPAQISDELLIEELRSAAEAIAASVGRPPRLVRPPYGGDPRRVSRAARAIGAGPVIMRSVDPADWLHREAGPIVEHVLEHARPGSIIDLHDGIPPENNGTPSRQATVDAVAQLVPALQERGFRLVTVSDLLAAP
jgi:peptidoglycan/xylan/chitin deacetylase (PgdA/CDA1 family)